MVQRDQIPEDVMDKELYLLHRRANEDSKPPYAETPYGATKTAELDVQFTIDPSYGLTKQRYGWYSNGVFHDSTNFTETGGKILMETTATGTDSARMRSAYPGQYIAHTVAEPGMGAQIPAEHLEYDSDGFVSLTHGEISFELAQWSDTDSRALNAHGISFESDAVYAQVRAGDTNVEFVPQSEWNLDKMDGNGPSGVQLRPEKGYIYLFIYSWYGEGAHILAIKDPDSEYIYPMHKYVPDEGNPVPESPNMPVMATVENQGTADPLSCRIGGMQYVTHGGGTSTTGPKTLSRTTEATRHTGSSYIDRNVTLTADNAVDPFAEPGRPLISIRRDVNDIVSEKALSVEIIKQYVNSGGDLYLFIFDEFDDANALTGANFTPPAGIKLEETRLQTDTAATDYTPSNAILRGTTYVAGEKNSPETLAGDATARLPLQGTAVVTAALPPGNNSTYAQPLLIETRESF